MAVEPKSFEIVISVIHSPWDTALGSDFPIMAKPVALKGLHDFIDRLAGEQMPEEEAFTVIAGMRVDEKV